MRARFYSPANGQFNRLDPFAGNMQDPQSLHKYAYVHGDPVNMSDPTGTFGIGGAIGIGFAIGAVLGGVDAYLGGGDVWDVLAGAAIGGAFGAAFGALAFTFPAFFASGWVLSAGLGFGLWSAYDSFSKGKDAQGYFRVITGILAPIALRQAVIARLTTMARQIRLDMARLWHNVRLRTNFYAPEPGVAGSHLAARIALTPDIQPGAYMYVVDAKGKMWLLSAVHAGEAKHSSLLPPGAKARAAGWLRINPDRTANVNQRSGHYMQEDPLLGQEEATWLQAITETLLYEGNSAVARASSTGSI